MNTPRRDFLGWVGASALIATTPAALSADPLDRAVPRSDADWDMSWTGRLKGKHKLVLDAPEPEGGVPILRANFLGAQYAEVYGGAATDIARVLVLRHNAIHLAMNDAFWGRFKIGEKSGYKDGDGKGHTTNPVRATLAGFPAPYNGMTLEAFQKSGGIVLACDLALRFQVAPNHASTGLSADEAYAAAKADMLPGVILQPSGIFAVAVAQEHGCQFVPAS